MKSQVFVVIIILLALKIKSDPTFDELRDSVTIEQQRSFIKINVLLNTPQSVVLAQLRTALPDSHLSKTRVHFWYREFKDGKRTDVDDIPKPGRPREVTNEENKEAVKELIMESEGMRTQDLLYETQLSESSLLRILREINAKKIKSRWIPHELTKGQQQARKNIAGKLLARYQRERGFLNKIVAIDETWLKSYDPTDSKQSSEWLLAGQKP